MNIKSNLQLLSEAASSDVQLRTDLNSAFQTVKEAFHAIPECEEDCVTEAENVLVNRMSNGEYYVEMTCLAPFMLDSGIKDIGEALDMVAQANGLQPREVGLCIESESRVDQVLEAAEKTSKEKKDPKILKKAVDKVNKNNAVAAKLLSKGYKVVKKKAGSKVCPNCGKACGKCECSFKESVNPVNDKDPSLTTEAKKVKSKVCPGCGKDPCVCKKSKKECDIGKPLA